MFSALLIGLLGLAASSSAKWTPPPEYALEITDNGRFLQEASGKPFFWQADTAWLLTHRLNFTETETYLADRAAKGYNVILNVGFTQIGIDSPNRNGDLTFHDEDTGRPNDAYWDYVDEVVRLAWEEHGIRMGLVPAWGYYAHDGTKPSVITAENGEAFGRFIGERYPYLPKFLFADTNPYWAESGAIRDEYLRGGVPNSHPSVDFRPVYDAVAHGIVAGERAAVGDDAYEPLLTMHPRNQWMPDAPVALASANLGDRDYLTFDAAQSGHADTPPNPPIPWWNARRGYETVEIMWNASVTGRARPVIDNEPHYELRWSRKNDGGDRRPWNASDVRIGSWQTAFSGAAGVTYGNDNVMQMYIPELFDPANSGVVKPWSESIHDPGAAMMQYITKAILDRCGGSLERRVPAQDIVLGDAGLDDKRVTALRDSKWSWVMVYTPTGKKFTVNTSGLKGKKIRARWLNPLDGSYSSASLSGDTLGDKTDFTPPTAGDHPDWTLVLEVKGKES